MLMDMAEEHHEGGFSDDRKWLWNGSEWTPTPPEVTENRNGASEKNAAHVEANALWTKYNYAILTISISFILFSLTLLPVNLAFQEYLVGPCKGSEDEICNGVRQVQFLLISQFLIFFIGGLMIFSLIISPSKIVSSLYDIIRSANLEILSNVVRRAIIVVAILVLILGPIFIYDYLDRGFEDIIFLETSP